MRNPYAELNREELERELESAEARIREAERKVDVAVEYLDQVGRCPDRQACRDLSVDCRDCWRNALHAMAEAELEAQDDNS